MTEYSTNVTRRIVETTPRFARERVANALLWLAEQRLKLTSGDDATTRAHAEWYQEDRKRIDSGESTMEYNERIWFLLEATPDDRDRWVSLITSYGMNYQLEEIAEVFGYDTQNEEDGTYAFLSPTAIRGYFFRDFLTQLHSSEPRKKSKFRRRLARLSKEDSDSYSEFHAKMDHH